MRPPKIDCRFLFYTPKTYIWRKQYAFFNAYLLDKYPYGDHLIVKLITSLSVVGRRAPTFWASDRLLDGDWGSIAWWASPPHKEGPHASSAVVGRDKQGRWGFQGTRCVGN